LISSGNAVAAFEYVAPGTEPVGTRVTFAEMLVGGYDVRWDWDATQRLFPALTARLAARVDRRAGQRQHGDRARRPHRRLI
jgi:hypothetical protein